jgi:uncharacterized protein YndB with AHSA1/START domain
MTKNDPTSIIAQAGGGEIIISRVFNASREDVFKAYTDPKLIPQWWGPRGYTTIVDKMELRPGGVWRFVQHAPDGKEYAFRGVYHLIKSPERIVNTSEFEGVPGHVSLETVALEEQEGNTKLTTTAVFQTVEDRDEMVKSGMEKGARETMDRLAELLVKMRASRRVSRRSTR